MLFFFFKQKTAYEMRISDWSSDVCSSDLGLQRRIIAPPSAALPLPPPHCCAAGRNFMTRLKSRFLVDLLLRRTEAAGGFATIVAKGDETSGIILVHCSQRGKPRPLPERRFRLRGHRYGNRRVRERVVR